MRSFVRAVETGSFSAVAREMATTQPTVSKQIAALEEHLGARLLVRSTRRLGPTEEGERYYRQCRRVLEAIEEAEASVRSAERPFGRLRVSCPVAFGQYRIVPRVKEFLDRYPDIELDLTMTDGFVDLIEAGAELAIRIGLLEDSSLVAHRIGTTRRVTVGSAAYFAGAGEPRTLEDLTRHNCLVYTHLATGNTWSFESQSGPVQVKVRGNFQCNNSAAIREAVLAGLGVAVSPVWLFGEDLDRGVLQVVLHDFQPPPLPIHAVYLKDRYQPARVRCFVDFLAAAFRGDPWVCSQGPWPEKSPAFVRELVG
nr:LysR family transcriptional regulator [Gloeobacter violaceus]